MSLAIKHRDDYELAHKYLCGDMRAGDTLYAAAFDKVRGYIKNHPNAQTLSKADRDDIFEDAMLTSVTILERYNGKSAFSTFVCGIANNKILEKLKANKREVLKSERIIEISEVTHYYDDPPDILIDKELREAVAKAQEMLSPDHRQVIQLRFNGMKASEIAQMINSTEYAVNSMFYRAIKAFISNFKNIYEK